MMTSFSGIVKAQGETLDSISDNIDSTDENVRLGNFHLKKANILKVKF